MTRSTGLTPELPVTVRNLLLTSPPGCGKTTVVRRLAERLGDRRLTDASSPREAMSDQPRGEAAPKDPT
jgi:stage III sporulation protein SpoIIIAA